MIEYRLTNSTVSQYTLENDATALLSGWPIQTDMRPNYEWFIAQNDPISDGERVTSLDGVMRTQGAMSGTLEWLVLTPDMISYLWLTFFGEDYSTPITLQTVHQNKGLIVVNAILYWPAWLDDATRATEDTYSNILFGWQRGTLAIYGRSFDDSFDASFG
jgi:hypothetical protein